MRNVILLVALSLFMVSMTATVHAQESEIEQTAPQEQALLATVHAQAVDLFGEGNRDRVVLSAEDLTYQNGWAFGLVGLLGEGESGPQILLYVAQHENNNWNVAVEGQPTYPERIQMAPTSLFGEAASIVQPGPETHGDGSAQLSLPFATGETWTLTGGPHHNDSSSPDWSALDFAKGGGGVVRAAREGVVWRASWCRNFVRVDHPDGWKTGYYHMPESSIPVSNGQSVSRGQRLGVEGTGTGCGGDASGDHVHFTLRYGNNVKQDIRGKDIGGWNVLPTSQPYAGCLRRNSDGHKVCQWDTIYNDGSIGTGGTLNQETQFENGRSVQTKTQSEVRLEVCADNLEGKTVFSQLYRDAYGGYGANTWNYSRVASSNCVTFTDMEGPGDAFNTTYWAVASLEPLGGNEAAQKRADCYDATNRERLCGTDGPSTSSGAQFQNGYSNQTETQAEVRLEVCADNLDGRTVYAQMYRDAYGGYPANTWNYSQRASGNCTTFTDMEGPGDIFNTRYWTVASLEPIGGGEAAQKRDHCYNATDERRLCGTDGDMSNLEVEFINGRSDQRESQAEVRLEVCADNLDGRIVYAQMYRDAYGGYPANTWNYSQRASGNCTTFTDMEGPGNIFNTRYWTVASLEPMGGSEARQKRDDCYISSGRTRLCGDDSGPSALATPGNLSVSATTPHTLRVIWNDIGGENRYNIERSTSTSSWAVVGTVNANVTSFEDSDLACNTAYQYRVRAYREFDNSYSSYSNTGSATTDNCLQVPAGFTANALSGTEVLLTWNDINGEDRYELRRRIAGENWQEVSNTINANQTSYNDTSNLICATIYEYELVAYQSSTNVYSTPTATTVETGSCPVPPTTPANFSAVSESDNRISLTWNDVSNETRYHLQRRIGNEAWQDVDTNILADVTSYVDDSLTCGTTYDYRLRAVNVAGASAYVQTSVTTGACPLEPPATPTNFNAIASGNQVDLTWNDVSNETRYELQWRIGNEAWQSVNASIPANTVSYSEDGLTCGTTYQFRLRATNDDGSSAWVNAEATTQACPSGTVVIEAQPATVNTGIGSTFDVTYRVNAGDQQLDSVAIYKNFDPSLLRVVNLTSGDVLDTVLTNNFDNSSGQIDFAAGKLSGEAPSGTFTVLTVRFEALAEGTVSPTYAYTIARQTDALLVGETVLNRAASFTANIVAGGTLNGSLTLPTRNDHSGTLSVNAQQNGMTIYDDTVTVDARGAFSVSGLPLGAVTVTIKHPQALSERAELTTAAGSNPHNFGQMRMGDTDNNDVVTITDFSLLAGSFGKQVGTTGYNPSTNFNGDTIVNIADFSLLAGSFGQTGVGLVTNAVAPVTLNDGPVDLSLLPTEIVADLNETFELQVQVNAGSEEVDSVAAYLDFDPNVLEVVSLTPGTDLSTELERFFDQEAGQINYAAGQLSGDKPSGTFTALTVSFRVKATPTTSSISFQTQDITRQTNVLLEGTSLLGALNPSTVYGPFAGNCDSVVDVSQTECEALVALYNETDGANWTDNSNWLSDPRVCTWFGVTCVGNSISQLSNLENLNLSSNELTGTIPPELGQLTNLETLFLDGNELSGTIPAQLGQLANLQELYLYNNTLSGLIPTELGQLANLQVLRLHNNALSGQAPDSLTNLTNISFADLTGNPGLIFSDALIAHMDANNWQYDAPQEADVDFDDNGVITPTDVVYVVNRVGTDDLSADLDGDGDVDQDDVNLVAQQLGQSVP